VEFDNTDVKCIASFTVLYLFFTLLKAMTRICWFSQSSMLVRVAFYFMILRDSMASIPGKFAPSNGSICVCNLPYGTDDNMQAEYFGTIGVIKVRSLQLFYDNM